MLENKWQSQTNAVINDKLQGTVVTYLRCGGVCHNLIKKGLLLSLPVKTSLKSVNIWHSYRQKGGLCCALSSTFSRLVPGAQSALDNHLHACNFAKYLHI